MSDSNDDPVLDHLRARRTALQLDIDHAAARMVEVELLIQQFSDGRSRVRRKMKGEVVVLPGNGAADTMPPGDPPAAA